MTFLAIISLCTIILLSYIFDLTSKKTKIPSVVLLMLVGVGIQQADMVLKLQIPDIQSILPIIGTLGLILIVLEGSLDLKLTQSTAPLIKKTFLLAFILFVITSAIFAYIISAVFVVPFTTALINVIPLSIISSAIAISGVYHLDLEKKEFIVYESTFSDIIGIVFFNFFLMHSKINAGAISSFFFEIVFIIFLSTVSGLLLSFLLQKITHHVKFIPIIAILVLVYALGKLLHLPSLLLVLMFGLFLNNIHLLDYKPIHQFIFPQIVSKELIPFKNIVSELTFIVRSFFFIMFGFYTNMQQLINLENLIISFSVLIFILVTRFILLKLAKTPIKPILYVAPRGLITILLFLNIPSEYRISIINEGLLSQIIFLSAFVMMFGLMNYKTPADHLQ